MDEKLIKRSVESIEMPEEMKERIIKSCKGGEAKPLILPKKRFPIGAAAAACVCVSAVALAGVGLWQAGALSEGGSDISIMPNESDTEGGGVYVEDISDNVINIIPLTAEEVEAAREEVNLKWDDYKKYSDEQLADYYSIDLTALSGIFPDVLLHWGPVSSDGRGVYSTDNGIYFDRNTYLYVDERTGDKHFQIIASRLGIPNSVKKLWSYEEMLSRIDGTTVAIGRCQDTTAYEAEFSTSAGTYFHITALSSVDELAAFISTIIEKTEQYLNGTPLTLDKLLEICSGDCSKLSWSDFEQFKSEEVGSGLHILQYIIEDKYSLAIGGVPYEEPMYMRFGTIGQGVFMDIRDGGLEEYIAAYPFKEPLTLDKLKEICSGDCSKLTWSDFEQFRSTGGGTGLFWIEYDIEGKYTLYIEGNPNGEPYIMYFHAKGQYYSIDIREESLEEYLNEPIPERDVINITPLEEDEINYFLDADFVDGEQIWLTDGQLSIYYGVDVTAFGNIPSYMTEESYTHNNGMRCIWKSDGVAGIYYDMNTFSFSNPDRSAFIDISMGTLMNSNDKLWENKKMRSRIGGRDIAIGGTAAGHYAAEFRSGDSQILFVVSACGISTEELHDVIASLVEQSEERSGDYTYPSQYIDALQMQAAKDNYQDDPAEFIFGVQHIIQDSDTVEEMYQALAEFDTEGRIDKVLLSFDGVPVNDGDIRQGMFCEVYYDNEAGWFNFSI